MSKRYFEFESIVTKDESNTLKIDLGTDVSNGMRFTVRFSNLFEIKSLLEYISKLSILKLPSYNRHQIDYKDWYANEIIHRITQDDSYYLTQSDAKKDVLKELLQRRNKLIQQIQKAMDYYEENKSRIDEMEKIRTVAQKSYFGPMISVNGNYLAFENINEYGNIYSKLSIKLPETVNQEEIIAGFGWMEYSLAFSKSIQQMSWMSNKEIILTNSKPRSDMRVLRRTDVKPFHQFEYNQSMKQMIDQVPIISSLLYLQKSLPIILSKAEFFSIADKIINNFKDKQDIIIEFSYHQSDFQVKKTDSGIKLKLPVDRFSSYPDYQIKVNTSLFYAIQSILFLIERVEIYYFGQLYGLVLLVPMGDYELLIQNNSKKSKESDYLRKIFANYIRWSYSKTDDEALQQLLLGNGTMNPSGDVYSRILTETNNHLSTRETQATILADYYPEQFTIEENKVMFEDDRIESVVEMDVFTGNLTWKCSCKSFHKLYKCHHAIGCFYFGVEEGWFFA